MWPTTLTCRGRRSDTWQAHTRFCLQQSWHNPKTTITYQGKESMEFSPELRGRFLHVFYYCNRTVNSRLHVSELCECRHTFFRLQSWHTTPDAAQHEAAAKTGLWAPLSKMWLYMAHVHTKQALMNYHSSLHLWLNHKYYRHSVEQ